MAKYGDESDADFAMRQARQQDEQKGQLREWEQKVLRIQRDLMARGMPKEDARGKGVLQRNFQICTKTE